MEIQPSKLQILHGRSLGKIKYIFLKNMFRYLSQGLLPGACWVPESYICRHQALGPNSFLRLSLTSSVFLSSLPRSASHHGLPTSLKWLCYWPSPPRSFLSWNCWFTDSLPSSLLLQVLFIFCFFFCFFFMRCLIFEQEWSILISSLPILQCLPGRIPHLEGMGSVRQDRWP